MRPTFNICGRLSAFEGDYVLPRSEFTAFGAPLIDDPQEVKSVSMMGAWTRIEWGEQGVTVTRFNVPLANNFQGIDNRGLANLQHSVRFTRGTDLPSLASILSVLADFEAWSSQILHRSFSSRVSEEEWGVQREAWVKRLSGSVISGSSWSSAMVNLQMMRAESMQPILIALDDSTTMLDVEDVLTKLFAQFGLGIMRLVPARFLSSNQEAVGIRSAVEEARATRPEVKPIETPAGPENPGDSQQGAQRKRPYVTYLILSIFIVAASVIGINVLNRVDAVQQNSQQPDSSNFDAGHVTESDSLVAQTVEQVNGANEMQEEESGEKESSSPLVEMDEPTFPQIEPPIPEPDVFPATTNTPPEAFFDLLKEFQQEPSEWKRITYVLTQVAFYKGNAASIHSLASECKLEETELIQLWEFTRTNKELFIGTDSQISSYIRESWTELGLRQSEINGIEQDFSNIGHYLQ